MKACYFDLILMDIDMPIMDGKTSAKLIRQIEVERGWDPSNIVFLTAYAEAKTQSELLDPIGEYRANAFLSKPASLNTIQRTLQETCSKKYQATARSIDLLSKDKIFNDNQKQILVVDDDPSNLAIVCKMVNLCGFRTLEARNGHAALDLYNKNWKEIKLVLMDCEMPAMDGCETTRRIMLKHKKLFNLLQREIIIYGLTGYVGTDYRTKCLDAGMKGVLEKPITTKEIRDLLLEHSEKN